MLFCGIDLHSNNCLVAVSDDADKVLYSQRLPNNLATICAVLSPYRQELFGVVVESTYNWYWLVDGLMTAGYSLHLANTTAIKQYDGLKHRSDESDARHLAHVLRLGLLPEGHIMPQPVRAVRDLARKCMQLVQQRTTQIVSVETCLAQQTGGRISGNDIKQLTDGAVDEMSLEPFTALGVKANLAVLQTLQKQIDHVEKVLAAHCRGNPKYKLLTGVAGIAQSWPRLFFLRRVILSVFPMLEITRPIVAASVVFTCQTVKRKVKVIPRTGRASRHMCTSRTTLR